MRTLRTLIVSMAVVLVPAVALAAPATEAKRRTSAREAPPVQVQDDLSQDEVAPAKPAVVEAVPVETAPEPKVESAPVAAQAPAPAPASLSLDDGWNARWALLFQLNNVLQNAAFLSGYSSNGLNSGIGALYYLRPEEAIRFAATLGRTSNPRTVTKTVSENGSGPVTTYTLGGAGTTSTFTLGGRADYLRRLMPTRIAPYVGAGLFLDYREDHTSVTDDVTVVDQISIQDDVVRGFTLGMRALVGAEWRVHPNFALFVEYQLAANVYNRSSTTTNRGVESTGGQTFGSRTTTESATSAWFQGSTGLAQGAQFGLAIQF